MYLIPIHITYHCFYSHSKMDIDIDQEDVKPDLLDGGMDEIRNKNTPHDTNSSPYADSDQIETNDKTTPRKLSPDRPPTAE